MLRKVLVIGGAAIAALVPAVAGLTFNPSLSANVPVPSSQIQLTARTSTPAPTATDDHGGRGGPGGPGRGHDDPPGDDHGRHGASPTSTRSVTVIDDKGGDRPAGVSDDGPGDDKGGTRTATATGAATASSGQDDKGKDHDQGDDKGKGGKHGDDDGPGHH